MAEPGAWACSDATEWFEGDITHIYAPEAIPVGGTHVVRVQVVDVTTEGWLTPTQALICHPNLPVTPTPSLPSASCASVGLVETDTSWGNIWNDILPSYGTGGVLSSNPYRTQHFRGAFDADPKVMRTALVQTAAPVCGTRMIAPTDYDPELILDNHGAGLTTFLNQLDITSTTNGAQWVEIPSTPTTAEKPEHLYHASYNGTAWEADTPGFTLPIDGLDDTVNLWRRDPGGTLFNTNREREVGPLIPSRIAYGRVGWDWLWHGTCDGGTHDEAWCLPDGHGRIGRDGIISATTCSGGGGGAVCNMACPATGAATEARYDFEVILDFIDAAWGDGTVDALPMGTDTPHEDLHLSQRAALRIMPYYVDQITDDWQVLPAFLTDGAPGCAATSVGITVDGQTFPWVQAQDATYMDQLERLVGALAASPSTHVELHADHSVFSGLDADARVFSVDVGGVGVDGEWTAPTGEYLGDHEGTCYDDGGTWPTPYSDDVYDILDDRWWSDILDVYNSKFPASTSFPHLVGKVLYSTEHVELAGSPQAAKQWTCWAPDEYVVGRRGTDLWASGTVGAPTRHVEGGYTGQRNGVRYDSWGVQELRGTWWALTPGEVGQYLKYSEAWEEASYQAEAWRTLPELLGLNRPALKPTGGMDTEAYGYWDLDELVRFSIARHFSAFNFKRNPVIPYLEAAQGHGATAQQLKNVWCDCSPHPDEPCVAHAIRRLLTETGPRIRLAARGLRAEQDASTNMVVRLWIRNDGNASLLTPYQLQLAFVDRADFDPLDSGDREDEPTFPRSSFGPIGATDLDSLLQQLTTYPIGTASNEFDLAQVTPPKERDPDVWADTSGGCATTRDDEDECYLRAAAGSTPSPPWAEYDDTLPTLPPYCTAVTALTCGSTPYPLVRRFEVEVETPSTTGSYTLLYRFLDASTNVANKQVHLDVPHALVGDASTQRWSFLGLVEVVP